MTARFVQPLPWAVWLEKLNQALAETYPEPRRPLPALKRKGSASAGLEASAPKAAEEREEALDQPPQAAGRSSTWEMSRPNLRSAQQAGAVVEPTPEPPPELPPRATPQPSTADGGTPGSDTASPHRDSTADRGTRDEVDVSAAATSSPIPAPASSLPEEVSPTSPTRTSAPVASAPAASAPPVADEARWPRDISYSFVNVPIRINKCCSPRCHRLRST